MFSRSALGTIRIGHCAGLLPPWKSAQLPKRGLHFSPPSALRASTASFRPLPHIEAAGISPSTSKSVQVTFPNGQTSNFLNVWLRDHCREERSYHPATRQRLVDTAKIPKDIVPEAVRATDEGIAVTWPTSSFEKSYESFYPYSFLVQHSFDPPLWTDELTHTPSKKVGWTREIGNDPPTVTYEEVINSEEGVYEWVKRIDKYGFSLVSGIPPTPEATEALVRRIAFIRDTHYGGFWDFTADLKHGDLAYSDVELRAHTDTTYFTDPCGLQLFHLLSPASTHEGGHNLLIDGFLAASTFRKLHPDLYFLFSTLPIPAHASGTGSSSIPSGVHMSPLVAQPVFTHNGKGELVQIRWNADDRDVVGGLAWEGKMEEWFEAVRAWEAILRSEEMALWSKMEVGTAVIFDNHRVLHGRSGFRGQRRLCGAYINHDDYRSRLRGLEKQFGSPQIERERILENEFGVILTGEKGRWEGWV